MDQRKHPRFSFTEPVGYQTNEASLPAGALAGDISRGGVRIRVQQFIPLRTVLELKIHMTNPDRIVPVKGQVMWVREVPHSEVYDIGIRFIEILQSI